MLQKLETILTQKNSEIGIEQKIFEFNGTDLHHDCFNAQLTPHHIDESMNDLQCIISFLKGLNEIEKQYYSEVIKIAKLIIIMAASNALSQGSFSALRRIKIGYAQPLTKFALITA